MCKCSGLVPHWNSNEREISTCLSSSEPSDAVFHKHLHTDPQCPLENGLSAAFALGIVFVLNINHLQEFDAMMFVDCLLEAVLQRLKHFLWIKYLEFGVYLYFY